MSKRKFDLPDGPLTVTEPTPAEPTPEEPKKTRRQLVKVTKVFTSKESLDAGQEAARDAGHTWDTRKFQITSANGETVRYALAFSPANAVGQVWESMGISVVELDPSERKPFQPTVNSIKNAASKLTEEERRQLMEELTRGA